MGQKARCRIDTFPDRDLPAHVADIREYAEYTPRNVQTRDLREDQVFAVKLVLDPAPELKPGMAVTVNLEESTAPGDRTD